MSDDQLGGEDHNVPQGTGGMDENIQVSNTGQRIRAIVGVIIVLVGAGIGIYFWMGSQKELEKHKNVLAAFTAAHTKDYFGFWTKAQIVSANLDNSAEIESQLLKIIRKTPVGYGKLLKNQALPIFDEGMADFQAIQAPPAYADKLKAVVEAYRSLGDAVKSVSDELIMLDSYLESEVKLNRLNNAWFNAQTWDDPQYHPEAFRYYKLLRCLLNDRKLGDMAPLDIAAAVTKRCADENDKAGLFRLVAFGCYPALLSAAAEPDQEFKDTLAAYYKIFKGKSEDKVDGTSKDALVECMKTSRVEFENDLVGKLKKGWEDYSKARKEFLDANNAAIGK